MSKNVIAKRDRKRANRAHFSIALERFAAEHELDAQVFGGGVHWRLENSIAKLDCWPNNGKYVIKEIATSRGYKPGDGGFMPHNYERLDMFLRSVFVTD